MPAPLTRLGLSPFKLALLLVLWVLFAAASLSCSAHRDERLPSSCVTDTQCGFKFFSAEAGRRIFAGLRTSGFSFDVELLVRAHALGYRITELPVVWTDGANSSLQPLTHGGQIVRELVRLRRIGHDLAAESA